MHHFASGDCRGIGFFFHDPCRRVRPRGKGLRRRRRGSPCNCRCCRGHRLGLRVGASDRCGKSAPRRGSSSCNSSPSWAAPRRVCLRLRMHRVEVRVVQRRVIIGSSVSLMSLIVAHEQLAGVVDAEWERTLSVSVVSTGVYVRRRGEH